MVHLPLKLQDIKLIQDPLSLQPKSHHFLVEIKFLTRSIACCIDDNF
jgi:hypothetical protein